MKVTVIEINAKNENGRVEAVVERDCGYFIQILKMFRYHTINVDRVIVEHWERIDSEWFNKETHERPDEDTLSAILIKIWNLRDMSIIG